MSGAATSNVLMFLAAMCAMGTIWLAIAAVGGAGIVYWVLAALLGVATVVAFRAYRKVVRRMDAEEPRT